MHGGSSMVFRKPWKEDKGWLKMESVAACLVGYENK